MIDQREQNLIQALLLGLIDWFQFFEEWKKIGGQNG